MQITHSIQEYSGSFHSQTPSPQHLAENRSVRFSSSSRFSFHQDAGKDHKKEKNDKRETEKRSALIQAIQESDLFKDYQKAFLQLTGLPLSLQEASSWQLPHRGTKNENPFCAMLARQSSSCAACLEMKARLYHSAKEGNRTEVCPFGLTESAVPLKLGAEIIGFLHTGQILLKPPQSSHFQKVRKQLQSWNADKLQELEKAYFNTRVMDSKQYHAIITMLDIFAHQIAAMANQLVVQRQNAEQPLVTRAKTFIREHQEEDLSLGQVAKAIHTSPFYFCKIFKKSTGLTFTHYLSRMRIEKGKHLLLNPHLRISEIAYEVGFQSLTHFNRVFKKILGQSPTGYRQQLPSMLCMTVFDQKHSFFALMVHAGNSYIKSGCRLIA